MTGHGDLLRALIAAMNDALLATGRPPFEFALTRAQYATVCAISGTIPPSPCEPIPEGITVMGAPVREVDSEADSTPVTRWRREIGIELVGGAQDGHQATIPVTFGDQLRLPRPMPVVWMPEPSADAVPAFEVDVYERTLVSPQSGRWRYELKPDQARTPNTRRRP